MQQSIALVHFEDSTASTRRVELALGQDGLSCSITPVASESALREALSGGAVDVVICSQAPHAMDPSAIIRRVRAMAPYVPVIALISVDDLAVEVDILDSGAADCLQTSRLGRLSWAIRRALAESEERIRRERMQVEVDSLEAQLHHAQRLANVARLAGGIAHDFNNLLTIINGGCQLLLRNLAPEDKLRPFVEPIQQAGARGADLTKRLLSFSRREPAAASLVNLNDIVADLQAIFAPLVGETISISMNLEPSLWPIQADPGEISQVVLNLVTNARDAMPDGGVLTIRTANVDALRGNGRAGGVGGVELVVRDSGAGMDDEVRARIFDPFFTTKPSGEGTGLGLATVHRIVTQTGGEIVVDTAAGRGTSMRIHLPRAEVVESKSPPPLLDETVLPDGTETVLVVEDEVGVREIVCWFLRSAGYRVLEAADADAAEAICRFETDALDLLVTDVVLPGASGPRLAQTLRQIVPELKTLFISGYPADAISQPGLDADLTFLAKPFSREVLLQRVRKTLGP